MFVFLFFLSFCQRAIGPPHLVRAVAAVQQWSTFSVPTPNQDAISLCLRRARDKRYEKFENYYDYLASEYNRKRTLLCNALCAAGITPIVPDGGFFVMGDTSALKIPEQYMLEVTDAMPVSPIPRDWAMSRWMTKEVGVTPIPPSAFYCKENVHLASNLLRFAFCKDDETILQAQKKFEKYFNRVPKNS